MDFSVKYSSPTNDAFVLTEHLALPRPAAVQDKTHYLDQLRQAVSSMQENVNKELTRRMEEDKTGEGETRSAVDEAKDEDNYGEELVEEE